MRERSAARVILGVVLPLIAASPKAVAGESGDVLKVVDDRDRMYAVELADGFDDNKPSGAFTLTTTR